MQLNITYLKRCVRSLMLHRLRSLLSTLGILFGVIAVISMLSIGEGAKKETLEQIEQLGINTLIVKQVALSEEQQKQARDQLSRGLAYEEAVLLKKRMPHIELQAPVKVIKASLPGTLQNMAPEIIATTQSYGKIKKVRLAEGRFLCDNDQFNKSLVCVIGADVAKALGQKGHIGKTLRIEKTLFQIVGILQSNQWKENKNAFLASQNVNQAIFIPIGAENTLRSLAHPENDLLSEIILQIKKNQNLTEVGKVINNILRLTHKSYQDYQIIIPQELVNQASKVQRTFNLVLGSIAAISLIVGGIGIMNMMLANVSERIREIGIRRALGATKMDIMMQFLTETVILTLIGALLGVLIGIGFSLSISHFAGWRTVVTLWSVLLSFGMAIGVGICSGLYPAYKAAILDPIVALRRE